MPQERLSNDEFFTRLSALLATRKDHGTVMLTQKRLSYSTDSTSTTTSTKPSKPTPSRISKHPSKTPPKLIHSPTKYTSGASDLSDLQPPTTPLPILIRATNALSNDIRHKDAHIKLATVVNADDLERFFGKYAEVCKTGFSALKKRDRKKAKSKAKGRRKKRRVETEGGAAAAAGGAEVKS